jgi:hypothetical protein
MPGRSYVPVPVINTRREDAVPNGGIPIHMIMRPRGSNMVVYCYAGEIAIYTSEEWEANARKGEPVMKLNREESAALSGFLRYWLGEQGPIHRRGDFDIEYRL